MYIYLMYNHPFTSLIKPLMNKNILLACMLSLISAIAWAEYLPITLVDTEKHPFQSEINDRPYELLISYPSSYQTDTEKRYPVLYVLDGYWDTQLIYSMYGSLMYDGVIPEFITVGISYSDPDFDYNKERTYDMTPADIGSAEHGTGGGDDFLNIIKTEFIPYIDKHLRTDPRYRVLGGSSLGGFFTLFTMLTETELFNAYIAISPATAISDRWLYTLENKYRMATWNDRKNTHLNARLFMSGASKEWPGFFGEILAFNQILEHSEYEGFEYKFKVVDGMMHAGTKPEAYARAIPWVFQPYKDSLK